MYASRFSPVEAFGLHYGGGHSGPAAPAPAFWREKAQGDRTPAAIAAELGAVSGDGGESMSAAAISVVEDSLTKAHRAMNYIEISRLNGYVDNIQKQEMRRIQDTHESMADNLLLTQRMYLMQTRETDKLSSRIRVLLYTMLAICFAFAFLPYSSTLSGAIGLGILAIVYLTGLLFYIRNSRLRRYDDWSKIYWRSDNNAAAGVIPADDAAAGPGECSASGGLFDHVADSS